MDTINKNIRYLRRQKSYTQQEFADLLGIKRPSIGAYEEGRAKPNLTVQQQLARLFDISLDELLTKDLENPSKGEEKKVVTPEKLTGKHLRVLSVTVDDEDRENIELIHEKAAAGYLNGFSDPEYIQSLPRFQLPFLPLGTYRAFEIKGDSMLPLPTGSIVIAEYVADWNSIKDGKTYVVISADEGIVYKRVFNKVEEEEKLILRSDNPSYSPYDINIANVLEIWQAKLFITDAAPESEMGGSQMMAMLSQLQQEIRQLKKGA